MRPAEAVGRPPTMDLHSRILGAHERFDCEAANLMSLFVPVMAVCAPAGENPRSSTLGDLLETAGPMPAVMEQSLNKSLGAATSTR
jgi:hypothetical protein